MAGGGPCPQCVPRLERFVGGHAGLSVGGQRALGRDGEADTDGVMCQPD